MGQEMENPDALAGAIGADCKADSFTNPYYRLRAERATSLCMVLEDIDPADAAMICCSYLEEYGAGDPVHTAFGDIRADAEFWADCAHPAELEHYFAASMKRLGSMVQGIKARKRLIVALWASLSDQDRVAFLSRIDPNGQFTGRGAL
ncbi:MAG: hypothetical protein WBB85_23100 [Albidovulum sp.]|uniref:hypothetical protein n=1 Tax=Albidovulum sp. TaxID=1872424 RepID=UPI003C92C961